MKTKLMQHFKGNGGRSLCQIEKTTSKEIPLVTTARSVTCFNCGNLLAVAPQPVPRRTRPNTLVHLNNDGGAWCETDQGGEEVTPAIARVDCDDCLVMFRRRLDRPHGARPGRRTSG
ncbi:MAG: hypothetical protein WA208_02115 [Thermoanaerobaculia bacterium]